MNAKHLKLMAATAGVVSVLSAGLATAQTTLYFDPARTAGSTVTWTASFWSTTAGGPYTQPWVNDAGTPSDAVFGPLTVGQTVRLNTNVVAGSMVVAMNNAADNLTLTVTNATGAGGSTLAVSTLNFDRTAVTNANIRQTVLFNAVNFNGTALSKTGVGSMTLTGAATGSLSALTFAGPSTTAVSSLNVRSSLTVQTSNYFTSSTALTFDVSGALPAFVNPIQFNLGSAGATVHSIGSLNTVTGSNTGTNIVGIAAPTGVNSTLNINQTVNGLFNGVYTSGGGVLIVKNGPADLTWVGNVQNSGGFNINAGRLVLGSNFTGATSGTSVFSGSDYIPISIAATGTLASNLSGRTIRGSAAVFSSSTATGSWTTPTDTRGYIVTTAGVGSAIEPTGLFGISRVNASAGLTVRADAANDVVNVLTFTPPVAAGGLVFDYSTLPNGTPGLTVTPLVFNAASVTAGLITVTPPPFAKLDPNYGVGGIDLSVAGRVSLRFDSINVKSLTWTGGTTTAWNDSDANWAGEGSVYAETLGIGGALGTLRGDHVVFDDNGNGTVAVRPEGVVPSSVVVNNSATAYSFSGGPINGTTSIIKQGPGTLSLTATNGFTGGISVQGGTVRLGAAGAQGTGPFTLAAGTTLGADAVLSVAAPVTTNSFTVDASTGANLTLTGNFTTPGTGPTLTKTGPGTLTLGGTATFTGGTVSVTGGTLAVGAGSNIVAAVGSVAASGSVDATARAGGLLVQGSGGISQLVLNGPLTGSITNNNRVYYRDPGTTTHGFDMSGTGRYDVDGGGTVTLTGALTQTGLTTIGSGKLILTRSMIVPGSDVRVTGGVGLETALVLDGSASATAHVVVGSYRHVTVGWSPTVVSTLSVATTDLAVARQRVLVVNGALNMVLDGSNNPSGTVDLTNNGMILKAGDVSFVRSMIAAGLTSSRGILTSAITTGTGTRSDFATLGVLLNSDAFGFQRGGTFLGQTVAAGDVLVRYTYRGDTDLNGLLDARDFNAVVNGWSNGLTGWENGDVNYDGVVDASDFQLFVDAYQFAGTPFDDLSGGGGAIPEPAALGLLTIGAPLLGRRRRCAR